MLDLHATANAWKVRIDEVQETSTSVLGFGVRSGGRVVLKISKHACDESRSGAVLKAFGGDGAVRVLEYEIGAVLLERLEPGEQLVNLVKQGEDEHATKILAQVIDKLARHSAPAECPTVADWGRGFDRHLASGNQQVPLELVHEARDVYQDLTATQGGTMLLHGDLQHYNVLFDQERDWIAIDPKGVVGELEYEIGPLLRNPVEHPELFANVATVRRRLEILTSQLSLNYARTLKWAYAQSVLSAIWDVEDGYQIKPTNPSLILAATLKPMLSW